MGDKPMLLVKDNYMYLIDKETDENYRSLNLNPRQY